MIWMVPSDLVYCTTLCYDPWPATAHHVESTIFFYIQHFESHSLNDNTKLDTGQSLKLVQ